MITKDSKIIVQGITGKQGSFHTKLMLDYGTNIVGGVVPGKKGLEVEGVPVFNSVSEVDANWSVIFVPAKFVKSAAVEALENGLNIVIVADGVKVFDMIEIVKLARLNNLIVIGPNCPGFIKPGVGKLGIIPNNICKIGSVGIVSRSGTLTYEIVKSLSDNNIGQSFVIGVGGDMINGFDFIDALKFFEQDSKTEKIILVGEIGGDLEERAAKFISENVSKPVVAYIAGLTAPEGKKMGHAGAIISQGKGTANSKIEAFEKVGVKVAKLPKDVVELIK